MTRPLVIFHSINGTMHCDDGWCAACIARMGIVSDEEPEFFPGIYGHEPPDVTGRAVYMLDFSYKRPAMLEIGRKAERLVVLDHHKTAQAELAGLQDDLDWNASRATVTFDMERSGAVLAWRYFYGNDSEPPDLVKRIEDGDLWRFAYPDTKVVQAALRSYPQTFDVWLDLFERPIGELAAEGVAVRRFIEAKVRELVPNARTVELPDGRRASGVNCPAFLASEVAGALAERSPDGWAVAYCDTATHRVYSLRSRGRDAPDVSEIAKGLGGGGHHGAAGFQVPLA